ncbi:hypothetical protein [Bordetella trematum]|uniref:hypothetical protein n=1 Tax=Bordetella trematum TaxID=123899 RepID=UPI0015C5588B|nr:hypothetical protein [Bordetella trematum]
MLSEQLSHDTLLVVSQMLEIQKWQTILAMDAATAHQSLEGLTLHEVIQCFARQRHPFPADELHCLAASESN